MNELALFAGATTSASSQRAGVEKTAREGLRMIEFLHTDCMAYMVTLPDNAFDLAVVDPPYGVGSVTYMPCERKEAHGGHMDTYNVIMSTMDAAKQRPFQKHNAVRFEHGNNSNSTVGGFGDFTVAPPPEYFKELFRVSRNQIIWGYNYFLLPPHARVCRVGQIDRRGFFALHGGTGVDEFSVHVENLPWKIAGG